MLMVHVLIGVILQVMLYKGMCLVLLSLLSIINNLAEVVQSNIVIFADDTKVKRSIIIPDNRSTLQSDLGLLVE